MKHDLIICVLVCVIVPLTVALILSDRAPAEAETLARAVKDAVGDRVEELQANLTGPRAERLKVKAISRLQVWVREVKSFWDECCDQSDGAEDMEEGKAADGSKPAGSSIMADARSAG